MKDLTPPAYWHRIDDIRAAVNILALAIKRATQREPADEMLGWHPGVDAAPGSVVTWQALLPFIADFWRLVCSRLEARQQAGRLKQWLNFLRKRYPEAEVVYGALRTVNDAAQIDVWLADHLRSSSVHHGSSLDIAFQELSAME